MELNDVKKATNGWVSVVNEDTKKDSEISHELHMRVKNLCKYCEENGVPVFIAYYLAAKGYLYRGVFPEEINTEDVLSEYGKFKQFLKVCIGFNEEDYKPQIKE